MLHSSCNGDPISAKPWSVIQQTTFVGSPGVVCPGVTLPQTHASLQTPHCLSRTSTRSTARGSASAVCLLAGRTPIGVLHARTSPRCRSPNFDL